MYFTILIAVLILCILLKSLLNRAATDVLRDLRPSDQIISKIKKNRITRRLIDQSLSQASHLRFLSSKDLEIEEKKFRGFLLISIVITCLIVSAIKGLSFLGLSVGVVVGLLSGYLIYQSIIRSRENAFNQEIVFFLPVVMERIVMAVEAGLDIVPALKVIDEIEIKYNISIGLDKKLDAVTLIFRNLVELCEAGLSFEKAVNEISLKINNFALKHALVHLLVAQREGGELIFPLRELSDATQVYYQESVEEDLAKLPIKATLPLLITFAGLIVTFMTGPLIQIMNVSSNPKFVNQTAANPQPFKDRIK
jgi:Flp pilus assembly protein TadB